MNDSQTEKSQGRPHPYQEVYKGVYKKHELERKIVWRDCLNCNKEFPGERYVRLCYSCHLRMKGLDQSIYRYEIDWFIALISVL
jgi:hypothetical protein